MVYGHLLPGTEAEIAARLSDKPWVAGSNPAGDIAASTT
jgi:hypothetical protein